MARRSEAYIALHKAADTYEAQFRARFVKTMQALQAKVSINDLALLIMQRKRHPPPLLSRREVALAIEPAAKVLQTALLRGGKLGAERIRKGG